MHRTRTILRRHRIRHPRTRHAHRAAPWWANTGTAAAATTAATLGAIAAAALSGCAPTTPPATVVSRDHTPPTTIPTRVCTRWTGATCTGRWADEQWQAPETWQVVVRSADGSTSTVDVDPDTWIGATPGAVWAGGQ